MCSDVSESKDWQQSRLMMMYDTMHTVECLSLTGILTTSTVDLETFCLCYPLSLVILHRQRSAQHATHRLHTKKYNTLWGYLYPHITPHMALLHASFSFKKSLWNCCLRPKLESCSRAWRYVCFNCCDHAWTKWPGATPKPPSKFWHWATYSAAFATFSTSTFPRREQQASAQ